MKTLMDLPSHIWDLIIGYCEPSDKLRMAFTCKELERHVSHMPCWKDVCMKKWPFSRQSVSLYSGSWFRMYRVRFRFPENLPGLSDVERWQTRAVRDGCCKDTNRITSRFITACQLLGQIGKIYLFRPELMKSSNPEFASVHRDVVFWMEEQPSIIMDFIKRPWSSETAAGMRAFTNYDDFVRGLSFMKQDQLAAGHSSFIQQLNALDNEITRLRYRRAVY